ncbi:uncharacterized protein K489DRAFT_373522 [Dissoconium aciculare CBS 342.82]|uniref:Uncharacterized protein n=1 Tax=Dissoconium aciculare CBS 342.82 TaxID=1314786 RepID=A0A6J3LTD6_9PEZI|nr:uncharacterized protein K489DRAFT_373522 [Dissoconium aciculare CBS 342.82]KAF1819046.1 hypothetical protein K489DRAFT_373522 [Dissoconium aciculare CBS 342.82]
MRYQQILSVATLLAIANTTTALEVFERDAAPQSAAIPCCSGRDAGPEPTEAPLLERDAAAQSAGFPISGRNAALQSDGFPVTARDAAPQSDGGPISARDFLPEATAAPLLEREADAQSAGFPCCSKRDGITQTTFDTVVLRREAQTIVQGREAEPQVTFAPGKREAEAQGNFVGGKGWPRDAEPQVATRRDAELQSITTRDAEPATPTVREVKRAAQAEPTP